jgi:hypothetical protein
MNDQADASRVRILRITTELLVQLLRGNYRRAWRSTGLPDDARIIGAGLEGAPHGNVVLEIWSSAFDPVPPGGLFPDLALACEQVEPPPEVGRSKYDKQPHPLRRKADLVYAKPLAGHPELTPELLADATAGGLADFAERDIRSKIDLDIRCDVGPSTAEVDARDRLKRQAAAAGPSLPAEILGRPLLRLSDADARVVFGDQIEFTLGDAAVATPVGADYDGQLKPVDELLPSADVKYGPGWCRSPLTDMGRPWPVLDLISKAAAEHVEKAILGRPAVREFAPVAVFDVKRGGLVMPLTPEVVMPAGEILVGNGLAVMREELVVEDVFACHDRLEIAAGGVRYDIKLTLEGGGQNGEADPPSAIVGG